MNHFMSGFADELVKLATPNGILTGSFEHFGGELAYRHMLGKETHAENAKMYNEAGELERLADDL